MSRVSVLFKEGTVMVTNNTDKSVASDTEAPRTKDFKSHLFERMITANDVLGFLLAAVKDNDAGGMNAAITMLVEIAADRELAGTLYADGPAVPAASTDAESMRRALKAAMHTIEGYRHGNESHDLADEVLPIVRAALEIPATATVSGDRNQKSGE